MLSLISFNAVGDNTLKVEDTTIKDVLKTFEDFYLKKDYQKALEVLRNHAQDISPAVWHYNMGTVHAEMQDWALARFHLLMAESQGLHSKSLQQNQILVEEKLDAQRLEKPLGAEDYFHRIGLVISDGILTSFSLLFLVIGLWIFKKKPQIKLMVIFLCLILLPLAFNWWIKSWPKAIVTETQTIHEGPSSIFSSTGELPLGVFVITQDQGDWKKIIYPSRFEGWIRSKGLQVLE